MTHTIQDITRPGDVVQVIPSDDSATRLKFGGAMVLVRQVKPWGIKGEIWAPENKTYPVRIKWEDIEYVGVAAWS